MWFSSWLRNRTVSTARRPTNRFRPQLEVLEDRCVPATFLLTTMADVVDAKDGVLSLREAIIAANKSPKEDIIVLPAGTYTLTRAGAGEDGGLTGDLDIKGALTINGAGAGSTVVDAGGLDRVFHMYNYAVTFSGMTIQGGNAVVGSFGPQGGGIYNPYTTGALTVNNCVIADNTAGGHGGGIYSGGSLTVNNSVISDNLADNGSGGGIYNIGKLTVSNSTLSGNSANGTGGGGGGIFQGGGGTMTVQYSTLSGNSALYKGGGIYYTPPNGFYPSTVQYCTISDNTASRGGGIANGLSGGTITVQDCTLFGNSAFQGGAIHNINAILSVTSCALTDNSASQGGGIYNQGTITVLDSTISGNSATEFGGGIVNKSGSRLTVRGSTVLDNLAPLGTGADLHNLGWMSAIDSTIGVIDP